MLPTPRTFFTLRLLLAVGLSSAVRLPAAQPDAKPAAATDRIVAAANAFLATLDSAAQAKVVFAGDDRAQRTRWSNLPTGIFERRGLRLADLTPPQQSAVDALLATALSPEGYRRTHEIMEGDEVLRTTEKPGRLIFGSSEYFVAFVGAPSATDPWTLQFGGHHLALNLTVIGSRNTIAPSFVGAQPAVYTIRGERKRPLGVATDLSFELINALDESQRGRAVLGARFRDLVLGPGQDGRAIVPEGVRADSFTPAQRQRLLDLIRQWVGVVHAEATDAKMREVEASLAETYFMWSGPLTPGSPAYFRIQGPAVLIEYAPQAMGGDATMHLHTIYRDPAGDYDTRRAGG